MGVVLQKTVLLLIDVLRTSWTENQVHAHYVIIILLSRRMHCVLAV